MGARHSTLSSSDMRMLTSATHFSPSELCRLYERFKALDRDRSGSLSIDELLGVPEFSMNPLASPLASFLLSQCTPDGFNFVHFVEFLSKFHEKASVEEKAGLAAALLEHVGVKTVVEAMVGQHLAAGEVDALVARTVAAVDKDKDGVVSPEDLLRAVPSDNIVQLMTIK